jgi:hypothetical protein
MKHISRRDFLKLSGLAPIITALWACTPQLDLQTPTATIPTMASQEPTALPKEGPLTEYILRRISYGPLPDEIEHAQSIGMNAYLAEQLNPYSIPDDKVEEQIQSFKSLRLSPAELLMINDQALPARELIITTLIRRVGSRRQLYERLVEFWSDHFNIFISKDLDLVLKTVDDRDVIRSHALSTFHDLLNASAHSPAMLYYLDNCTSSKEGPNENYAREVMELHTLSVDGGYTHMDVEEVARVFSGWSFVNQRGDRDDGRFIFRPETHDSSEKHILGNHFPASQGIEEGERLIDMLAHSHSTARFISKKLARHFVADNPPESLVRQMTDTFLQTGGAIREVLSTLLLSDEFIASLGGKLKRPIEFVISAVRQTRATVVFNRTIYRFLESMGQPPFGWDGPNGFPDTVQAWIGASSLMARWNFALALAFGAIEDSTVNWQALVNSADSPEAVLDSLSRRLLLSPLPEPARAIALEYVRGLDIDVALPSAGAIILASPYFQFH